MTLHRFTFRAMAAENEVQVHCEDASRAEAAAAGAIAEVQRIEAKYSRYRATSVVSRINAQAGGAPVAIDAETSGLLAFAARSMRPRECFGVRGASTRAACRRTASLHRSLRSSDGRGSS